MTARPERRPHQIQALANLQGAYERTDRAQLHWACGTGKTLVGRWLAEDLGARSTLVVVPSLALVAQTLAEWRAAAGWHFEAVVVCSDPSTSRGAAERTDDDGVVDDVPAPYWATQRARVTTSHWQVARFLGRRVDDRPQVVFSTYHSAPVVVDALRRAEESFDLMVCDEAHRLAGRPREDFRVVLDDDAVPARKRLFLTATPLIVTGANTLSMDDPAVFGEVADVVTFGEAIEAELLSDYQVLVVAGRTGISRAKHDASAVPATLLHAIDRHGLRRLLTFHGRVAKAAAFAGAVDCAATPRGTEVRARHVAGTMSAGERGDALAWLAGDDAGEVRVVSNARCLTEGIDVPAVDGILFADQRSSAVDIVQAVGRVLRVSPGKGRGTVIVPVALPEGSDDDSELAVSAFAHVWSVLRGLRAQDLRLAKELDDAALDYARGQKRVTKPTDRVQFVLPGDFDEAMLQVRLVQEVGSAWTRYYAAVEKWADLNPGRRLPRLMSQDSLKIGEWAFKQRQSRAIGTLSADRVELLERIPAWYWTRAAADWDDTFAVLERHGRACGTVADSEAGDSRYAGMLSVGIERKRLGVWIAEQRQARRAKALADDQAERLASLPGWDWDGGLPAGDVAMVEALRQYCEFEKHPDVPETHVEDGLPLGQWLWAVRRRRITDRLHPALADEISAATPRGHKGSETFQWHTAEAQWRLSYSALRQFAAREGHAVPTGRYAEDLPDAVVGIGQWVARQRFLYRRGELDTRYAGWLEALPGWKWEVPLTTREYGEPVDLGGHRHGTAKGMVARCPCRLCLDARRASDRKHLARRREIPNGVPSGKARRHIEKLEAAGAVRSSIVAVSGVPLGVIRKIASGEWPKLTPEHELRLLATTVQMCATAPIRTGSRGRLVSADSERIDAGPTRAILDDLAERGFGNAWVARELGYIGGLQMQKNVVTRRIADAIADLAKRVGDLRSNTVRNRKVPPLADLLREASGEEQAS